MPTILDQVKELRRLADQMEASYRPEARKARKARRLFVPADVAEATRLVQRCAISDVEFVEVLQPAKDARVLWVNERAEPEKGHYLRADGTSINVVYGHTDLPVGSVGRYFTRFVEMPE